MSMASMECMGIVCTWELYSAPSDLPGGGPGAFFQLSTEAKALPGLLRCLEFVGPNCLVA